MGLDRQKAVFSAFWPKMAIFSHFPEKSPGSYRAKSGKFGQKWPKSSKTPKSGVSPDPDPAGGVVLHQPLAAGPCTPFPRGSEKRGSGGPPGGGPGKSSRDEVPESPPDRGQGPAARG